MSQAWRIERTVEETKIQYGTATSQRKRAQGLMISAWTAYAVQLQHPTRTIHPPIITGTCHPCIFAGLHMARTCAAPVRREELVPRCDRATHTAHTAHGFISCGIPWDSVRTRRLLERSYDIPSPRFDAQQRVLRCGGTNRYYDIQDKYSIVGPVDRGASKKRLTQTFNQYLWPYPSEFCFCLPNVRGS